MLNDFYNSGIPGWLLLLVAAALVIYAALWFWTHIAADLLLQNIFHANQVELPKLGQSSTIPESGTSTGENTAMILSRAQLPLNPDQPAVRDFSNVIYPVAGRNGLHFAPDRCTGCGLCVYTCPTGAASTHETQGEEGYLRRFDLRRCIFCGLCESACPTSAIRLTLNAQPDQSLMTGLLVEARLEATPCRLCDRKVPQSDLMAERIYELQETGENADEEEFERRQLAINPQGLCLECQKRVLEAEEIICG